jgi:hypothetical protein
VGGRTLSKCIIASHTKQCLIGNQRESERANVAPPNRNQTEPDGLNAKFQNLKCLDCLPTSTGCIGESVGRKGGLGVTFGGALSSKKNSCMPSGTLLKPMVPVSRAPACSQSRRGLHSTPWNWFAISEGGGKSEQKECETMQRWQEKNEIFETTEGEIGCLCSSGDCAR